jgi:hypothetical protein
VITNAVFYYITRLCHYAFFAKRVAVIHANLEINSARFQGIIGGISIAAFIAGIVQNSTETPIVEGNLCNTNVISTASIASLGIFVALDTIVTLALLKEFVRPIKESLANNLNDISSGAAEKEMKRRRIVRKFEVSCYIASFSTVFINGMYVLTRYSNAIGHAYDVLSAIDAFVHAFAVFYTYQYFEKICRRFLICKSCDEEKGQHSSSKKHIELSTIPKPAAV